MAEDVELKETVVVGGRTFTLQIETTPSVFGSVAWAVIDEHSAARCGWAESVDQAKEAAQACMAQWPFSRPRAGDVVRHRPTDEEWVVASVSPNGDQLSPAGWPGGYVPVSDCELVNQATDQQHVDMLLQVTSSHDDSLRRFWAVQALCRLAPETVQEHLNALETRWHEAQQAYLDAQQAYLALLNEIAQGKHAPQVEA